MTGCGKAYGSEGACKTHVRIKHQDIFSVQQQSMTMTWFVVEPKKYLDV